MTDLGDVLAANVRAERARRKWRQVDLAERLNIAQRTVADIEGGRTLTAPELLALCRVFGIPLAELVRGADPDDLATLGLG